MTRRTGPRRRRRAWPTNRQCLVRLTWSVILVGGTAAGGRAYRAALRSGNCVLADSLARNRKVEAKPMQSSARA
jgi:hypothetical protein